MGASEEDEAPDSGLTWTMQKNVEFNLGELAADSHQQRRRCFFRHRRKLLQSRKKKRQPQEHMSEVFLPPVPPGVHILLIPELGIYKAGGGLTKYLSSLTKEQKQLFDKALGDEMKRRRRSLQSDKSHEADAAAAQRRAEFIQRIMGSRGGGFPTRGGGGPGGFRRPDGSGRGER